jgi:hypothetical protein
MIGVGFDMVNFTSLDLVYTKPDGETLSVTAAIGGSTETIGENSYAANHWVYYDWDVGNVDQSGTWKVDFTYTNTTSNPDDTYKNTEVSTFEVAD